MLIPMIKKNIILLFILITSLICWHFILLNYKKVVEANREKVVEAFNRSIETDWKSRLKQLNIPYVILSNQKGDSEYATIQEEGKPTIRIKKTERMKSCPILKR